MPSDPLFLLAFPGHVRRAEAALVLLDELEQDHGARVASHRWELSRGTDDDPVARAEALVVCDGSGDDVISTS